jgi:hypothetical protein
MADSPHPHIGMKVFALPGRVLYRIRRWSWVVSSGVVYGVIAGERRGVVM